MKFGDIKNLEVAELKKKLQLEKETLFMNKMKHSLGQLENPLTIRGLRRKVAWYETALSQKKQK